MTILMTGDTVGGVWTYAIELAGALAPQGVQVALATMGAPMSADQRREVGRLRNVTVFESTHGLEWMPGRWDDVAAAGDWLLELEAQVQPDLIHLNGYVHASLAWRAPVLVVGHSCVLSWWQAVKRETAPAEWDRYREAVTRGIRSADIVVAPSQAMLDALRRHYAPLPCARVIYNGRDPSRFTPADKHAFILSAGRAWDEAKNMAALEAVAPQIPWPICIAGEGVNATHVHPLGHLSTEALAEHLAHASIYALPARYEPFGLSILEAALCGCALVLGDIDSLREIWSDCALFVPPDDAQSLKTALMSLIGDDLRRRALSQRALERAGRYTPTRSAEAYVSVYRQLVANASVVEPAREVQQAVS